MSVGLRPKLGVTRRGVARHPLHCCAAYAKQRYMTRPPSYGEPRPEPGMAWKEEASALPSPARPLPNSVIGQSIHVCGLWPEAPSRARTGGERQGALPSASRHQLRQEHPCLVLSTGPLLSQTRLVRGAARRPPLRRSASAVHSGQYHMAGAPTSVGLQPEPAWPGGERLGALPPLLCACWIASCCRSGHACGASARHSNRLALPLLHHTPR
jgi:hypothetical protein